MDMGLATIAVLWLSSGALFWGAFVGLGLGFREASREQARPVSSSGLRPGSGPSAPAATRVLARTSRS